MKIKICVGMLAIFLLGAGTVSAQLAAPPAPWRGAGPTPCVGSDGGIYHCPDIPGTEAVRAGKLFDSKSGMILSKQAILIQNDRITEVGAEGKVKIPAGARMIDLQNATVLPGLIDAHTHMFDTRGPKGFTENEMVIAVSNVQADLRAGYGGAGHEHAR